MMPGEIATRIHSLPQVEPESRAPFYFSSSENTIISRPENIVDRLEPSQYSAASVVQDALGRLRADIGRAPDVSSELEHALAGSEIACAQPFVARKVRNESPPRAIAAGAIPFEPDLPASFVLLDRPRFCALRSNSVALPERSPASLWEHYHVRLETSAARYTESVATALSRIAVGEISKVVLARTLVVDCNEPISRTQVLRRLLAGNSEGYAFSLETSANGSALVGVSPELLIRKSGSRIFTNPLAGSRPRGQTDAEDRELARDLSNSDKDYREHAMVVREVIATLRSYCRVLHAPERPSLLSTPAMWHLSTHIEGELLDDDTSSLELAQALHPTPAVCGAPRDRAQRVIAELEPRKRGFFSGLVGYCDANGDGEWAIALRCAEISDRTIRVFAGAGIVEGSSPWSEFDETAAKMRTVLRALGLS